MKQFKQYMFAFLLVSFANICHAEMTGSQWLNFVSSPESLDRIQSIVVINSVPLKYCECLGYRLTIPAEVTPGQLVKVVEKYLLDHPEMLHLEINSIICSAYNEVWDKSNKKKR